MNQVTIPHFGITTTRLGFGCSSLVGMLSRKEAHRLIDTAYDSGIRHFDVARSYGRGAAESLLADALGSRRSQVTITSKFGIPVPQRSFVMDLARRLLRPFANQISQARSHNRSGTAARIETLPFTRANAEQSLETSLRELRTDFLDVFLLHEASAQALNDPDLLDSLEQALRAGKIRAYGVGSDLAQVPALVSQFPAFCPILQHEWSPLIGEVPIPQNSFRITHGILARSLQRVQDLWDQNRSTLDLNSSDRTRLAALLLRSAALEFPNAITLFSARAEERIVANVNAFANHQLDAAVVSLKSLLRDRQPGPGTEDKKLGH